MAYIRSELKCTPCENAVHVFLKWIILQMEMKSDIKKIGMGQWEGDFTPLGEREGRGLGVVYIPTSPYTADPMLIIYPLKWPQP